MNQRLADLNAERYLLSGIITGDTEGIETLNEDDFTTDNHRVIFNISNGIYADNSVPDILLVASAMNAKGMDSGKILEPIIACDYIPSNRLQHIHILKTYSAKRQALQALTEITKNLQSDTTMERLQSREQVVSHMSRTFKEIAMNLKIPVILWRSY